jgi:hypothetical protein
MTTVTFDLDDALRRLHGDLSFCLRVHATDMARECCTVAKFLARQTDLVAVKQVAARARAVAKFLEISRHV